MLKTLSDHLNVLQLVEHKNHERTIDCVLANVRRVWQKEEDKYDVGCDCCVWHSLELSSRVQVRVLQEKPESFHSSGSIEEAYPVVPRQWINKLRWNHNCSWHWSILFQALWCFTKKRLKAQRRNYLVIFMKVHKDSKKISFACSSKVINKYKLCNLYNIDYINFNTTS